MKAFTLTGWHFASRVLWIRRPGSAAVRPSGQILVHPRRRPDSLNVCALLSLSFLLIQCAAETGTSPRGVRPADTADSRALHRLFQEYFEDQLRLFPVFATATGDRRYNDRVANDISDEHREQQQAVYAKYLRELAKFSRETLEGSDRLNYELLGRQLTQRLEGLSFNDHFMSIRHSFNIATDFPRWSSGRGLYPFTTIEDYDHALSRARDFRIWVDTAIGNMRRGMELGIVESKLVMEKTLPQLEALLVTDVTKSAFYGPVRLMPTWFSEEDRARLTYAYTRAIEQDILATYWKLHTFIRYEYLPRSRQNVGIHALQNGRAWYAHLIQVHTTTQMKPDEIFQLGLSEIERIKGEMGRMRQQAGFEGGLNEFLKHLESKTTAGYTTKEDLIRGYDAIRTKVTPALLRLFGRLPRTRYEIRPVEAYREDAAPSSYGAARPRGTAIVYFNTAGVKDRPRRPAEWLFLHEAVPGHHFQLSIQREQEDLPRFRRFSGYTAFVEGWATYAESLGRELGLYDNPYQYFDWLSTDMFKARRLVVDVGINHYGWTREQARQFLLENPGAIEWASRIDIDRHLATPGQALAYKIGQLKISAIREKAERALGARFDIRAFHDELLKDGALPLDLLEMKMDAWLTAQQR